MSKLISPALVAFNAAFFLVRMSEGSWGLAAFSLVMTMSWALLWSLEEEE